MASKKTLAYVTGSGGHLKQCLLLHKNLQTDCKTVFIAESSDPLIAQKTKALDIQIFQLPSPRKSHDGLLKTLLNTGKAFFCSMQLWFKIKPDFVLSTGPGLGLVFSLVAKILGSKVIFIESWSRVTSQSSSAKYAYKFADLFFYQWPEQHKNYPKGHYLGKLSSLLKGSS